MIVVDTNILASALLNAEVSLDALALLYREQDICSNPLWETEFAHIMIRLSRNDMISHAKAKSAFERAAGFVNHQIDVDSLVVYDLATQLGVSAYDARFVATAIYLKAPLYTYDKRLLKACHGNARVPPKLSPSKRGIKETEP